MKKIALLAIFASMTGYAQYNYDSQNILYSAPNGSPNTVMVGTNTVQGNYGTTDRAIEVVSSSGSYLNLKAGTNSIFLSNTVAFPSGFYLPPSKTFGFFLNSLTVPSLQLETNGNVSIGRVGGPAGYKLAVAGKIIAEELKVQLQSAWPDYVFGQSYQLPTLEEVEKQIQEKGYLSEMPSACEVEQNGVELGEMNRLLLQKVEELTLYLIQQNKEIKQLKSDYQTLLKQTQN